jgi:K+-transporting ATPase A subunit
MFGVNATYSFNDRWTGTLFGINEYFHLQNTNSVHLAFNTATSFVTNTNWQAYGGESTLTYLTQMLGLTVQNFVSAATGMAVLGEVLYAYTSMGNNNGSAFGGLNANTFLYNTSGGLAMLLSRFWIIIPTLALAGSLARKNLVPAGPGTLPIHTLLFVVVLIGIVVLVGALTFIPALALGPIVEHLIMISSV